MGCHSVDLLHFSIKTDGLNMLGFSSEAGFFLFVWPLAAYLLEYSFSTLHFSEKFPGPCNKHDFFTGRPIAWMACIIFLVLSRATLLGVGRRCRFSSFSCHDITGTVVICPSGYFRRCSYFIELLGSFHPLEPLAGLLVVIPFKLLAL